MLDRLSLLAPGWTERSAADVGVALVELLAYAADNLSYRQDAIANEAYLATAHNRVSVRRHARLVDYVLHEGCNARAWVHVEVASDFTLPGGTALLTRTADRPVQLVPGSKDERDALDAGALVFETVRDTALFTDLNVLRVYTWGDSGCCLPRGATRTTLRGAHPNLKPNDVLMFEEVVSPTTFESQDADRAHRWAVRLTAVRPGTDPSGQLFDNPPADAALPVTEIEWDASDAVPFPLCISVQDRPGLEISVARGNIVLADHGKTVRDQSLGTVPAATRRRALAAAGACSCEHATCRTGPATLPPGAGRRPGQLGLRSGRGSARAPAGRGPLAIGEPADRSRSARSASARDAPHWNTGHGCDAVDASSGSAGQLRHCTRVRRRSRKRRHAPCCGSVMTSTACGRTKGRRSAQRIEWATARRGMSVPRPSRTW